MTGRDLSTYSTDELLRDFGGVEPILIRSYVSMSFSQVSRIKRRRSESLCLSGLPERVSKSVR